MWKQDLFWKQALFYVSVREWLVGGGFSTLCVESADGKSVGERRRASARASGAASGGLAENNINEVNEVSK